MFAAGDDVVFSGNGALSPGYSRLANHTTYLARDYAPSEEELKEMAAIRRILLLDNTDNRMGMWQSNAEEITNRALSSIFFPKEGEQKSILLKRGSIQLCDNARRDLMLFSRGCVVSSIDFCKIAEDALYQDKNGQDGALIIDWGQNSWRKRFDLIDFDKSGSFDKHKLRKFFLSQSLPITEEELAQIFERLDTGSKGLVFPDDFRKLAQQATILSSAECTTSTTKKRINFLLGFGQTFDNIKKSLTNEVDDVFKPRRGSSHKKSDCIGTESNSKIVENAILFSDIDSVETLDEWGSREIKKYVHRPTTKQDYDDATIRHCSFAIFIRGKKDHPLVALCSKAEEAKAWMDAFRVCIGGQKSKVLGRKRSSVCRRGVVFGINSSRRWWGDAKELAPSVNWDGDD
ncbi:hypothetical protein ACHAWX_006561 [Stephanocyclus meneghinianus]